MFISYWTLGSGKTKWAKDFSWRNPQARYVLVGLDLVIDCLRVIVYALYPKSFMTLSQISPQLRSKCYAGEADDIANLAINLLDDLVKYAVNMPRNYILDQTK